jgi:hypothetical protein
MTIKLEPANYTLHGWHLYQTALKEMRPPLQQRLAGILRDDFSHSIAQPHDFVPIGIYSFRARLGFWLDERAKNDLHTPKFR